MNRRIAASLLWVWAIATAWSFLAWGTGVPTEPGPFVALAVGAFVGMDPLRRIWTKPTPARSAKLTSLESDVA